MVRSLVLASWPPARDEMPGDPEPFGTVGLAEAEPLEFAADGAYLVWRGRGRAGEHGVQRPALLP